MNERATEGTAMVQQNLFETEADRALLDQLLADSRLEGNWGHPLKGTCHPLKGTCQEKKVFLP